MSNSKGLVKTSSSRLAEASTGLRAVHDASIDIANRYQLPADDKPATIGAIASMIIGSALFEDWAYPANKRIPGRTRMIRELSTLIVDGTTHRSSE
jgi:hypothetical protein